MHRGLVRMVCGVATVLTLAGPASAVDMCFSLASGLYVVKNYKKPSPGKCRPLAGYEASTSVPYPATGTACMNASSTKLYVNWNVEFVGPIASVASKTELPYPSLSNGTTYYTSVSVADGIQNSSSTSDSAYPCAPAPLP